LFTHDITRAMQTAQRHILFREGAGRLAGLKRPSSQIALFISRRRGHSPRIPVSQFQLYMDERQSIASTFDIEPWFVFDDCLSDVPDAVWRQTTMICLQTHYDVSEASYIALTDDLLAKAPGARLVHFDLTAPADLRQAAPVSDRAEMFVKKHVLRDRGLYGRPTLGMTNLSDHYARSFGIEKEAATFPIPDGFYDKLEIGPTFFTEFGMQRAFRQGSPESWAMDRPIDVHARFGAAGLDWYEAMREQALAAARDIRSRNVLIEFPVPTKQFMAEMRHSKICYSPFGYGEICWRDFEALSVGALLMKPDASHIELDPGVLVAGESYVPLRWDSADLSEKVDYYLRNEAERIEIARNGFLKIKEYFAERRFEAHFERLFGQK